MKKARILTLITAAAMSAAILSGCSGNENTEESTSASSETTNMVESISAELEQEINTETRPIAEGDDYAINKINNKTSGDVLPGGYELREVQEESQGKMYTNDKSQLVIRAYNYKEDLQAMDIWADNACAIMKISNITSACDTVFEEPENVKVCGFDGIRYDYQIIQNDFIAPADDPDGEKVKTELFRYSARAYFFYSDQDAYIVMFDTREENWDEQLPLFEEFVADLEVTPTEY